MSESIFKSASSKRELNQAALEAAAKNEASNKKVHVNFNLYEDSRDKIFAEAKKNRISASALLELWIAEKCD